jgi:hypothetical protein
MKKLFVTIVVFILTIAACTKSQSVRTLAVNADGKIMGSIGCSAWLIQLDNNTIIQPANLSSFNITIRGGQRVNVTYQKSSNQLSTCESGEVVNLISIVDK